VNKKKIKGVVEILNRELFDYEVLETGVAPKSDNV